MKKKIIYVTLSIVLAYIVFYRYLPPYTPVKSAQLVSGLKIPHGVQFEKDDSFYGFTGSGSATMIIAMDNKQFESFTKTNNWKQFKRFPMEKSEHPPVEYDTFFEKRPQDHDNGYYKIVVRENSFKMVIVDNSQKKMLIYETID
jgi:hypothetical protein